VRLLVRFPDPRARIPIPRSPRRGPRAGRGAAALALVGLAVGAGLARADAAASADPPHLAEARELVRVLGVEGDLAALAGEAGGVLLGAAVPAADREALAAIAAESFAPERLGRRVAEGVAERWDAAAGEAARAWLRTAQARGILARGRTAAGGEACRIDRIDGIDGTDGTDDALPPASPERLALLRRVAAHTASPERARRRAALLQVAMLEAANEALPASRRLSAEALARLERAARGSPEPVSGVADAALRCHYRDVTSDALARAAAFFDSPAGRWAVESVEAALDDTLRRAARTVARRVVERFAPPPAAPGRSAGGPARGEVAAG